LDPPSPFSVCVLAAFAVTVTCGEVLAADGLYAAMYRRQMGDLTEEVLEAAGR
jgi:hypothetical protein